MAAPLTLRTDAGDELLELVEFETRVRRGEVSPQSLVKLPAVTGDTFVPACELALYQSLNEPKKARFRRAFSIAQFPWLTSAFILLNVAVYLVTARGGVLELDDMVRYGAKVGPLVADLGEFWRLLTANGLHRDAVHVGVNMFVLFNVGGMLENTYRALDYLFLVVFTGVATMATSLALNDAITVGASGIVFGCLGGVLAFGLKYRLELPSLYRRIFSEAAIPTVLGLLFIGFTSAGVDNWAHLGGLFAGILMGAVLKPAMLAEPRAKWDATARVLPTLLLVFALFAAEPLLEGTLPRFHVDHDDPFGLVVPVPLSWGRGTGPLVASGWTNGIAGLGRATFAAESREMPEGADADAAAQGFIEERFRPDQLPPDVRLTSKPTIDTARVADRDAVRVRATLSEPAQQTRVAAYFVPRGTAVYQLVFTWPADLPRYGKIAEQMAHLTRFEEPERLRTARAEALLFPGSPPSLARLGHALLEVGEPSAAAQALVLASKGEPSNARYRVMLSRARLDSGDVEGACEASQAAVTFEPQDAVSLEADARCELAKGNLRRALARLSEARAAAPSDERLKAAESKLRAAVPDIK
jgi:membrane associated rhomboid family serine protease